MRLTEVEVAMNCFHCTKLQALDILPMVRERSGLQSFWLMIWFDSTMWSLIHHAHDRRHNESNIGGFNGCSCILWPSLTTSKWSERIVMAHPTSSSQIYPEWSLSCRFLPWIPADVFGKLHCGGSQHEDKVPSFLGTYQLGTTPHPGFQSPPGLWHFVGRESRTKPLFATGILGGGIDPTYQHLRNFINIPRTDCYSNS